MSQNRVERNHPLLSKAKADLGDQKIVAFLGPAKSGKTVMAALLHDALFRHFAPQRPGRYAHLSEGFECLESVRNSVLAGNFPAPAPEGAKPIQLKMRQGGTATGHATLHMHDMSGRDYRSLLASEISSAGDRLDGILRKHKGRFEPYGPLSFVAVAAAYAVAVDCAAHSQWGSKDAEYAGVLGSLSQLRGCENRDGLAAPLAVILTKADLLPDPGKGAEALIRDGMPRFHAALRAPRSGARGYFKFHVETGRDRSNEPQPGRIKVPLSYSKDECVRFLGWALENA